MGSPLDWLESNELLSRGRARPAFRPLQSSKRRSDSTNERPIPPRPRRRSTKPQFQLEAGPTNDVAEPGQCPNGRMRGGRAEAKPRRMEGARSRGAATRCHDEHSGPPIRREHVRGGIQPLSRRAPCSNVRSPNSKQATHRKPPIAPHNTRTRNQNDRRFSEATVVAVARSEEAQPPSAGASSEPSSPPSGSGFLGRTTSAQSTRWSLTSR